ncbi:MAG: ribosome maturation factor RimP [Clostridiales bacterium]
MKKKIVELTFELVQPITLKNNYELVDVEYVKEGTNWFLRIFIDKEGGINLDDCQVVSEELSNILDELDPIKVPYHLEVSSPGLDRPLKSERDFIKYNGEEVDVFLYKTHEGKKVYRGQLLMLRDNVVHIKDSEGIEFSFNKEKISKVKRVFKF